MDCRSKGARPCSKWQILGRGNQGHGGKKFFTILFGNGLFRFQRPGANPKKGCLERRGPAPLTSPKEGKRPRGRKRELPKMWGAERNILRPYVGNMNVG